MTSNDEAYFRQIPWCCVCLDDPSYVQCPGISLIPREGPTGQTLFSKTLRTEDTLVASISLYRTPPKGQPVTEATTFLAIGSGLNGHAGTAHGGTVAAILDECAGFILRLEQDSSGTSHRSIFTVYLHVNYLKPVRTPQVVMVKSRVTMMKGRKIYVVAELCDRQNEMLASAEALFVQGKCEGKL